MWKYCKVKFSGEVNGDWVWARSTWCSKWGVGGVGGTRLVTAVMGWWWGDWLVFHIIVSKVICVAAAPPPSHWLACCSSLVCFLLLLLPHWWCHPLMISITVVYPHCHTLTSVQTVVWWRASFNNGITSLLMSSSLEHECYLLTLVT